MISVPSEQPARTVQATTSAPPATAGTPAPATPPPDFSIPANVLEAPGAVVVAKIEPGPLGWWILRMEVALEDRSRTSGSFTFRAPEGWAPRWDSGALTGSIRVSRDGWAAIQIEAVAEDLVDDHGILVLDMLGDRGAKGPILGSGAVWLADGTLLMTLQGRVDGIGQEIARRIEDHGFGASIDLLIRDECARPFYLLRYIVLRDGSGLAGYDSCRGERPVTLRWDGRIVGRDPSESLYLQLGGERRAGGGGNDTVVAEERTDAVCAFDPCPLDWRRPDGTRLPIPGVPSELSWTRDGKGLVIFEARPAPDFSGSNMAIVRDADGGLDIQPLAPLPPAMVQTGIYDVIGMTDWAAVVEADEPLVGVVPLDGSPMIGPLEGTLALVNP